MRGGNASIENEVYLHDFNKDDVISYAKELDDDFYGEKELHDFDDDEILELAKDLRENKGFEVHEIHNTVSMIDKEKIKFFFENYENIKLEDLENLI